MLCEKSQLGNIKGLAYKQGSSRTRAWILERTLKVTGGYLPLIRKTVKDK